MVHRLAVGTGAITNVRRMVELGADVVLTTDDGTTLWRDGAWMADLGLPVIVANHMTAEIPGLRKLAKYLGDRFPGVAVEFVGPTCSYEILATERHREAAIRMRRDNLDDLPPLSVPEGYAWRPMKAEEAGAFAEVMKRSHFAGDVGQEWFEDTFSRDPEYDASYLQIIWKGDKPVAGAAAWQEVIAGDSWGLLHWVGVVDTERGKGLGEAVILATLRRLRERGFGRATLITHDWRLPAVAAYLRNGFRPWPDDAASQATWDRVLANLDTWRKQGKPQG